ncbi:MAG: type IX secretion system sortase PorU [Chitinophaga sp.]|uniref:type IX secretion system sortase PorU n=1 Tax=Chitinophaga sp. TaxID=1869181 RepID=UPI0025C06413|nr:type IX secretion system sortase PorU [Chitinophaga sp.]MBV8254273.1 type IX secretion system sortase PorU [Chitinophaga sp.]
MKLPGITILALLILLYASRQSLAQSRKYKPHSALATGQWYKIAVSQPGIYRIDAPFLRKMGLNPDQIPANQIRLFGTGGRMLPENNGDRPDDLPEVALQLNENGDNIINGNDALLFYAPGPHNWIFNADTRTYSHQYNIYSDSAWYFLCIGPVTGARIAPATVRETPSTEQRLYTYHSFYEKDSLNFLRSGKQWFAEEFSLDPDAGSRHTYRFTLPAQPQGPVTVNMRVAARGINGSNFKVCLNKQDAATAYLLPVSGNVFESFATAATGTGAVFLNSPAIQADVDFLQGDNNARGWLDYLEILAMCPLQLPSSGMLDFRTDASLLDNQQTGFTVSNANAQTQIWDVTDIQTPVQLKTALSGDAISCTVLSDRPRELLAFQPEALLQPVYAGKVNNQDLHAVKADMIIATVPELQAQALRLAQWHQQQGLDAQVVTMDQVYNEFSSGSPDPTALRDFLKMQYDRGQTPQYLLLFGAASYDYRRRVKNNTNMVPSWQSTASLDPVSSYVTDDYFGLLTDKDDINRTDIRNVLQLAIGRIPARNSTEAATAVDKIIHYREKSLQANWRNQLVFIADDEDNNLHFNDAELLTQLITTNFPAFNISKIYLDAYTRQAGTTGPTYPDAVTALNQRINQGALIVNYSGHGSNTRLAEENIVDGTTITQWQNQDFLPLLLTATCDFAPFDNPAVLSLGQKILLQQATGAIALMTTTRAVFAASNREMNLNYIRAALTRNPDGSWKSLGTAAKEAKNITYAGSIDIINNRKFQLLGDPALTLAFPVYRVMTDSINGQALDNNVSVPALSEMTIVGHLEDDNGQMAGTYNGDLYTTIYSAPIVNTTKGNTAASLPANFEKQESILFRGMAHIRNGRFVSKNTLPVDAINAVGNGKISYYATGNPTDGAGVFNGFHVTSPIDGGDKTPPVLQIWLNNRQFNSGDLVGPNPVLLLDLSSSSGINIGGLNPDHNLLALLDSAEYIVLNDYFSASLDDYKKGTVVYPLKGVSPGKHRITVKAWDNNNNSVVGTVEFDITDTGVIAVEGLTSYPNPFHNQTRFVFSHNLLGMQAELTLQIFNIEGRLMKTLRNTIIPGSNRFDGMPWDGTGESGVRLSPGMYLYRLTISSNGKKKVKGGKVILF